MVFGLPASQRVCRAETILSHIYVIQRRQNKHAVFPDVEDAAVFGNRPRWLTKRLERLFSSYCKAVRLTRRCVLDAGKHGTLCGKTLTFLLTTDCLPFLLAGEEAVHLDEAPVPSPRDNRRRRRGRVPKGWQKASSSSRLTRKSSMLNLKVERTLTNYEQPPLCTLH